MFKLVTDNSTDLPESYFKEHNVECMNLSYIVDDTIYGQDKEIPWKEFYNMMRNGVMPSTSQINPDEFKKHFERFIETDKEILYLAFSSGLSGTYNNGRIAAQEIMDEHPDVKIVVVDTLCASMGQGLLVHKAIEFRDKGFSLEQTAEWVNSHLQEFVHIFTVDDLFHLYRGGRVSKATAFVGTLAGIKPRLHVDSEGHLVLIGKERGRKKSLASLVDYMEKKLADYPEKNDIVFISHGDAEDDAKYVAKLVEERFGISNVLINNIGPTIGAHAGPGTIALFFMGSSR